ncbi:hypothetical protein D9619_008671 [Psilocybe cf. subviscida]|uniref:Uncharacterized protein n=1 Tax=Psilocybe cf. subviscida TaxID=2480587 RepID=A0A8H5F0I0_9AGAR|nr:hypothetical protein D9619_008671 [Psilocybe cf. subviscida]
MLEYLLTDLQSRAPLLCIDGTIAVDRPLFVTGAVATGQIASGSTGASSQALTNDPSPRPRRESPDVYVNCLLTTTRGYPLWIPSPNMSLPTLNRKLGVSIGDVGVLTPEGGFSFLFNIFHDADHPINAAVRLPGAFVPFTPAVTQGDTERFVEWNAGSFLADESIIRVDDGTDRSITKIEATGREGAVLMIPEDIVTEKLQITTPLRDYVDEYRLEWYSFVKHTLRRDIANGDLRVVYGCRKSSGFGIATAFNAGQRENTQLSFLVEGSLDDTSRCPYRWTFTGSAEVKAGPSGQSNTEFGSTEPVRNQCLFVNTISVKVPNETWHSAGLSTVKLGSTPGPGKAIHGEPISEAGPSGSTIDPPSSGSMSDPSPSPFHQRVFHPSVILHDILETITPGLPTYMVCDDDWAPFLSDSTLNARDFVDQILENRIIVEDRGMVFFCARDDENLLEELAQRPGVQISFRRIAPINNSFDINYTDWQAERRVSHGKTQWTNTPVQGGLDQFPRSYHHAHSSDGNLRSTSLVPTVSTPSRMDDHKNIDKNMSDFLRRGSGKVTPRSSQPSRGDVDSSNLALSMSPSRMSDHESNHRMRDLLKRGYDMVTLLGFTPPSRVDVDSSNLAPVMSTTFSSSLSMMPQVSPAHGVEYYPLPSPPQAVQDADAIRYRRLVEPRTYGSRSQVHNQRLPATGSNKEDKKTKVENSNTGGKTNDSKLQRELERELEHGLKLSDDKW